MSADKLPTISLTYMRSHETFGHLRVTLKAITRKELNETSAPTFGCNDIDKFVKNINGTTTIPSVELWRNIPRFSIWETAIFPIEGGGSLHKLLKETVLNHMKKTSVDDSDIVEYVDLYVIDTNSFRKRIKIQVVTSC